MWTWRKFSFLFPGCKTSTVPAQYSDTVYNRTPRWQSNYNWRFMEDVISVDRIKCVCKVPLKQSSQRCLLWVGLHKEPSLKARTELFATNITVLEMRWRHVTNLGCHDAETARTITRGPITWYDHGTVVSRAKPRTKGNGDDRWTDVAEVHWWSAMDTRDVKLLTVNRSLCPGLAGL